MAKLTRKAKPGYSLLPWKSTELPEQAPSPSQLKSPAKRAEVSGQDAGPSQLRALRPDPLNSALRQLFLPEQQTLVWSSSPLPRRKRPESHVPRKREPAPSQQIAPAPLISLEAQDSSLFGPEKTENLIYIPVSDHHKDPMQNSNQNLCLNPSKDTLGNLSSPKSF